MNETVSFVVGNLSSSFGQGRVMSDLEVIAGFCAQYVSFEFFLHLFSAVLLVSLFTMNVMEGLGFPVKEKYPSLYRFFDFQVFAFLLLITLVNLVLWWYRYHL